MSRLSHSFGSTVSFGACRWPILDPSKADPKIPAATSEEKPVHAMFLADTHLLGSKNGHWFDKLRREWQMYRTFQTVMAIHRPDVVFILGDVFDEGQWCSSDEFEGYISRFQSMFSVPKNTHLESDEICDELDEAPAEIKDIKFRERWECLSREATEQLLDILHPRLVVDGHTHHGCRKIHREDILEVTVPSFSWRNKDNPSFLLGIFTPNNYAISKCYMPVESTVISIYIISGICIFAYLFYKLRQKITPHNFMKLH